jgi:ferric iron reductase protein FhuF
VSAPAIVRLDPLAPIRAALEEMDRHPDQPPVNGVTLDAVGPPQWRPATALTNGDATDELITAAQRRWDAPPHTAAALAWKAYTYWLALPAVVGFATCRRVPLPRADHVQARWSDRRPFLTLAQAGVEVAVLPTDPLAAEPRAVRRDARVRVVPDEVAMLARFRTAIRDEHLDPMLAQIRRRVRLGAHTLWGSLASGIAYGLSRAAVLRPGPTTPIATEVLTALDLADLVDLADKPEGGLEIRRRTCCLAFTLPNPTVCPGCCIG